MKRVWLITILLCVTGIYDSVDAFDGNRRGFVMGGGIGIAPLMQSQPEAGDYPDDDGAGFVYHFLLGYAWDEHNLLIADRHAAVGESEFRDFEYSTQQTSVMFAWCHYFGPVGRAFFSTLGLGTAAFCYEDYDSRFDGCHDLGGAVLLGGGYEFSPHWQAEVRLIAGRTTDESVDHTQTQLSIQISGLLF